MAAGSVEVRIDGELPAGAEHAGPSCVRAPPPEIRCLRPALIV